MDAPKFSIFPQEIINIIVEDVLKSVRILPKAQRRQATQNLSSVSHAFAGAVRQHLFRNLKFVGFGRTLIPDIPTFIELVEASRQHRTLAPLNRLVRGLTLEVGTNLADVNDPDVLVNELPRLLRLLFQDQDTSVRDLTLRLQVEAPVAGHAKINSWEDCLGRLRGELKQAFASPRLNRLSIHGFQGVPSSLFEGTCLRELSLYKATLSDDGHKEALQRSLRKLELTNASAPLVECLVDGCKETFSSLKVLKTGSTPLPVVQHLLETNDGSLQSLTLSLDQVYAGVRAPSYSLPILKNARLQNLKHLTLSFPPTFPRSQSAESATKLLLLQTFHFLCGLGDSTSPLEHLFLYNIPISNVTTRSSWDDDPIWTNFDMFLATPRYSHLSELVIRFCVLEAKPDKIKDIETLLKEGFRSTCPLVSSYDSLKLRISGVFVQR